MNKVQSFPFLGRGKASHIAQGKKPYLFYLNIFGIKNYSLNQGIQVFLLIIVVKTKLSSNESEK